MQDNIDALKQAEDVMMDAVNAAITQATREALGAFQSLGLHTPAHTYFADVVMRRLFLHLCGADAETAKGGDPDRAWDILYIGRGATQYWERDRGTQSRRRKTESNADLERERRDKSALAQSAERLATDTAIRALIEHSSISDPTLRARISAMVEARVGTRDPLSQVEQDFANLARASVTRLIGTDI